MRYKLRIGGSSNFVSSIDPFYERSSPPGRVMIVPGWDNPDAIIFGTLEAAEISKATVERIEGWRAEVEEVLEEVS